MYPNVSLCYRYLGFFATLFTHLIKLFDSLNFLLKYLYNNSVFQIHYLDRCASTNLEARKSNLKENKAIAVYTFNQTKGRGSLNRDWICPINKSLAYSFVIAHDNHLLKQDPRISLIVAISLVSVLSEFVANPALLKWRWPNDIIYDGNKLAGILIEWAADRLIIGIGLNINTSYDDFPEEIASTISSLNFETDSPTLKRLIDKLGLGIYQLCTQSCDYEATIKANLTSFDNAPRKMYISDETGKKIGLTNLDVNPCNGVLSGIDDEGNLKEITSIHSIVYN